jgi:hypothetical protein
VTKRKAKRRRQDGRQGPGNRSPADDNAGRKKAKPDTAPGIAAWVETCLDNTDPILADIYRTIPADPAAQFAFMQRGLVAHGIWAALAQAHGQIPMETAIQVTRESYLAAAQLLRLSRDALGTSEFDAIESHQAKPGKHGVLYNEDGSVNLRLVTTNE